jgi:LacI family transcriptional regulator
METEIEKLVKWKKPLVLMDRCFPGMNVPFVMVDNYKGVQLGMDYLIKKGSSKIGFVTVDLDLQHMKEREKAYIDSLQNHAIKFKKDRILRLTFDIPKEEAVKHIGSFINKNTNLDAVFFSTNYLGVYGLASIRELGMNIPGDMKVICFDDHDAFELFQPAITVVQQPIQEIAKTALLLLVAQLGHAKPLQRTQILITPKLLLRASA